MASLAVPGTNTNLQPKSPVNPLRQLTFANLLGIGINSIIGSGIFFLPGSLWRIAGAYAPLAWLLVGGLCGLVALCFAELAGQTERSGGPYCYASDAFGPYIGYAVGWVTFLSTVFSYTAVAKGFGVTAATMLQNIGVVLPDTLLSGAVIITVYLINVTGVRGGARVGDLLSVVKILSLLGFSALGLFLLGVGQQAAVQPPLPVRPGHAIMLAAFAGLFAMTGFEYIPVPAGETKNPQRTIPLAMLSSVLSATALYALVQYVAGRLHPALGASQTPLIDAAAKLIGDYGIWFMSAACLVSTFGFCTSSALVAPRYLEVFANDGFVPVLFARRSPQLGTPIWAVSVTSVGVLVLLLSGLPFERLADVANVAVVVQYIATCLAVLVLRRKLTPTCSVRMQFVIPLGPLVPILALIGCCAFLTQLGWYELRMSVLLTAFGVLVGLVWRRHQR